MAVNGTITTAGAAYLSQRISAMATVTIDHFVMANVPGIDESTEADQNFVLDEDHIVATAPIYRLSHNGENSVVYSMVLDGNEGDYDFNWYGLVTNTGVILSFAHIPTVAKRAAVGQVINRNFILPFSAAKALTGAEIPAESWQFDFTETIAEVTVSLLGPLFVYVGDSYTYQFTDWDDFSDYSVSSDIGTATLGNATLTLDIPANATAGECLLTVIRNGSTRIIPIRIGDPIVAKPILIAPVHNAPNIVERPTLTSSPFKTFPSNVDAHLSTSWELYDANDNLVFSSYNDTTNKVYLKLSEDVLVQGGRGYKWRVKHKGETLGESEWSEYFSFTTTDVFMKPGAIINGDIVVGQLNGYWYLVAPSSKRKKSIFYRGAVLFSSNMGVKTDSSFSDYSSGFYNTPAILAQYPAPEKLEAFNYVSNLGYFVANRSEIHFVFSQAEIIADVDVGPYSLSNIKSGTLQMPGTEGFENYGSNSNVITSTEGYDRQRYWQYSSNSGGVSSYPKGQSGLWVIPVRRIAV